MALTINDPTTNRLARELAATTGESIAVATRIAIEERLSRVRRRSATETAPDVFSEIIRRGRARTTLDDRSEAEILGYGPDGLPG